MNYDLAMMALEGLSASPISVRFTSGSIELSGEPAGLKDLARLLLLMAGEGVDGAEEIELTPGIHLDRDAPAVRLRLS